MGGSCCSKKLTSFSSNEGETAAFRKMETPTPQTMDRASNMMKDTRAEETPQVTHSEVLQCASKVLEIEMERLQKQKIEFLNQHKDMVGHPSFSFLINSSLMFMKLGSTTCRSCKQEWNARERLTGYKRSTRQCLKKLTLPLWQRKKLSKLDTTKSASTRHWLSHRCRRLPKMELPLMVHLYLSMLSLQF